MSISAGKRYERELASKLRERAGWSVERITGSGGFSGTKSADLQILPYAIPEDIRIDDYLDANPEKRDHLITPEVKYKKDASGFKTVYQSHLRTCGLGTPHILRWGDGYCSGGLTALIRRIEPNEGRLQVYGYENNDLPNFFTDPDTGVLSGERTKSAPDFVALRGSTRGWPFIWLFVWRNDILA